MQCSHSREAIHHCHKGELCSLAKFIITAFPSLAVPEPQSHESAASWRHLLHRRVSCRLLPRLPPQHLLLALLVCRLHYGNVRLDHFQVLFIQRLLCFSRNTVQISIVHTELFQKDQFPPVQNRYELAANSQQIMCIIRGTV